MLGATLLLGALVAGCGAAGGDGGDPVATIYVSAPLSGPASSDGTDIRDGALLALIDAGGKVSGDSVEGIEVGGVKVDVKFSDDASNSSRFDQVKTAANARAASEDSTSIAYIGELDSGATRVSLPITNNADILQVSPGSGASDLVRAESFNDDVPTEFQTNGKRSFARLVPSDEKVGEAMGELLRKAPGAGSILISDGSEFAQILTDSARSEVPELPRGPEGKKAENCRRAVQMASVLGVEPSAAPGRPIAKPRILLAAEPLCSARILKAFGRRNLAASVITSDAVLGQPTSDFGDAAQVEVVSAATDPGQLAHSHDEFVGAFIARFGRSPGRYAAYGYEAMASVLAALDRSDDATDRDSVTSAYFDGTKRDSVLTPYSIDEIGDTSLDVSTVYVKRPGKSALQLDSLIGLGN